MIPQQFQGARSCVGALSSWESRENAARQRAARPGWRPAGRVAEQTGRQTTRQGGARVRKTPDFGGSSLFKRLYEERKCFKCEKPGHSADACRSKTKADGSELNKIPAKRRPEDTNVAEEDEKDVGVQRRDEVAHLYLAHARGCKRPRLAREAHRGRRGAVRSRAEGGAVVSVRNHSRGENAASRAACILCDDVAVKTWLLA